MDELYFRLVILAGIITIIGIFKALAITNKFKIRSKQRINRDLFPFWQPGKESIMFFMSDTCVECEKLQKPALNKLKTSDTPIYTINAAEDHKLANYFHILTVPTTIIVDNQGIPQFVNQGFTNEKILSEQLAKV